jgi:uncharacterized protein (TIGR03437 family)
MCPLIRILSLTVLSCILSQAQVNVLTANGSNDRTNANLDERQLSRATVGPDSFGKLAVFPVDGQVYAAPLYVSGLAIPGKGSRNVLFVTTMHNSVYAYDADSASPVSLLWRVNLGPSIPSATVFGTYGDISNEIGILGTGAIDLQRGVLYAVSETLERGAAAFYLHALDLSSGEERMNGPVAIEGAVPGGIAFDPRQHIQRPGLLLANDSVYIAFGSHRDQQPYHGWVLSYDASDLTRQAGVFATTPGAMGGSIWQSGRGLAADSQGNVYAIAGNGNYDGAQNFGESFLKLSGALALADSFTPANWQSMSDNDFDLSAGPALLPGSHTVLAADKLGNFYVLNGNSMGQPVSGNASAASAFSIFNFAVWNRPGNPYVYVQGEREPARCFQVADGGLASSPVSATSNALQFGRIGMTLSANGIEDGTGILWETTGDYNDDPQAGTLHAFDASNLAVELWNSDMNPGRDRMGAIAKFANPTVANGKVYVPTLSNAVAVYGLLNGGVVAPPAITSVSNAASYSQEAVSPGELVAIFGSYPGLVTAAGIQLDASGLVATSLAGVRVLFDGVPGPMAYANADQVNAVVPFGLSAASTEVRVEFQGQLSGPVTMALAPSLPGIFAVDGSGVGQGLIFNQDGAANSAANPAAQGSVIVFYATGVGALSPPGQDGAVVTADSLPLPVLPASATVGGQPAQVLYAGGGEGMVEGIIQVNLRIPDGVPAGPAEVVLRIADRTSQPGLTVALQGSTQTPAASARDN